ncbi:MAG: putative dehydrogenase [Firmicutes bacterium]|nr:putative dehydrogenase [Bacillota bacterium]
MRVAVIGLGSMGKRRIRLIRKYDETIQIVGIDTKEERRVACTEEYGIETFGDLAEAPQADCAFVCTSPLSHNKIITQCLTQGLHVFTELNLVADGYDTNIALARQQDLVLVLSSTFLYREEVKQIRHLARQANCMLNYTYHIGQYLPDWHPWENYKDFFVGNKQSNGCREIFAIELPWLTEVFGDIVGIDVVKSKMSSLDIDYADNYLVILQHASGCKGTLAVDVVARKAVRNLEVFGEQLYLRWDGSPTGLYVYDFAAKYDVNVKLYKEVEQLDNYAGFVVENAYADEIAAFFEAINTGKAPTYNFEQDKEILKIIDRIEA